MGHQYSSMVNGPSVFEYGNWPSVFEYGKWAISIRVVFRFYCIHGERIPYRGLRCQRVQTFAIAEIVIIEIPDSLCYKCSTSKQCLLAFLLSGW